MQAISTGLTYLLLTFLVIAGPAQGNDAVAVAGGQPITEADLQTSIDPQLRQLRNQEYELKRRGLDELINQRLLDAEAKKRGETVARLLEREVESKVAEPTDTEILAFYLGQRERVNRPFAEVRDQFRQSLKQIKLQQARQDYVQRLREKAEVRILLRPPKVEVAADSGRMRGSAKAAITIVEFSDFQCPYCQKATAAMKEVLAKYEGRVRLSFRDFPLRHIHAQAQMAAEAGRCAGEQGKFWEYHDLLFANPGKLDKAGLLEHARSLRLQEGVFEACLANGKFKTQVEQDLREGTKAGVSGTPAFFVNGIFLNGAQPASAFEKVIEEELAWLKQQRASP